MVSAEVTVLAATFEREVLVMIVKVMVLAEVPVLAAA